MKRIEQTDLILDGKRFLCQEVTDVVELGKQPEMVEVTIKCTISKKDYEKLMEEIDYAI
ncbi:hypothetical protein ORN01_25135 [Bacillus cereus]|uniref:hypothetical protein n=1 Tax=Bacillus cereus TaxID=1396 RepID=UPI002ABFC353|nr:hypothetical protein [Bacillus cereus]MDZ4632243.1 hypothetical protein [Bacillus cereus]